MQVAVLNFDITRAKREFSSRAFPVPDPPADAMTSAMLKQLLAEILLHQRKPSDPINVLIDAVERYIRE